MEVNLVTYHMDKSEHASGVSSHERAEKEGRYSPHPDTLLAEVAELRKAKRLKGVSKEGHSGHGRFVPTGIEAIRRYGEQLRRE
jgi:hypothetical protein